MRFNLSPDVAMPWYTFEPRAFPFELVRDGARAGSEHQWRNYRLYGKLDDCSEVRELLNACMRLKATSPGTKRAQVLSRTAFGAVALV